MSVLSVTKNNFDKEVKQSTLPVLVDFWAEWCGPCRMIGPIVEELASELAGRLKVAKVNVDEAQDLAGQFGIMSIPTLLLFKNGEVADQIVGAMSKSNLMNRLNKNL